MFKRAVCVVFAAAVGFAAAPSHAQSWPSRGIEIVVAAAAGSGPDASLRLYTERLAKNLGQSVIVNNRPGGSGVVGVQAALRATPDGHTFFLGTPSQLIINKYILKDLPYNPDTDLVPVSLLGLSPYIVLSNPQLPAKNLQELVAYDRANPGKTFLAYEGAAAKGGAAYFKKVTGTDVSLVPYVNPNQSMTDTLAGQVQLTIQGAVLSVPLAKEGKLRALAVTGDKRYEFLPDVPTMNETFPQFGNYTTWIMVLAPKGTPADAVQRMSTELGRISQMEETKQAFRNLSILVAESATPDYAASFLREQSAQFAKMAAAAELKPE